jgi:hypothetical protein
MPPGTGSYERARRRRFTLAATQLCHGASMADAFRLPRAESMTRAERCAAVAFSRTMRRYSAAEQLPVAIIQLRHAIVSHEHTISSAAITGSGTTVRRFTFFIARRWLPDRQCASHGSHVDIAGRSAEDLWSVSISPTARTADLAEFRRRFAAAPGGDLAARLLGTSAAFVPVQHSSRPFPPRPRAGAISARERKLRPAPPVPGRDNAVRVHRRPVARPAFRLRDCAARRTRRRRRRGRR